MDDTRQTLIGILRQFSPWISDRDEAFPMDRELRDLGVDSMTIVTLIFELESAFGINIADEMLTHEVFQTPATIEAAVRTLTQA